MTTERLAGLLGEATGHGDRPLPWTVWTSCSFRRIGCDATGGDGDVLSAYNQRSDNHPDLTMPEGRLVAWVELTNATPHLLSRLAALEEALKAAHFYIDASDREIADLGITRDQALYRARQLDEAAHATLAQTVAGEGEKG